MDSLDAIIYGMCAIYGLILIATYFTFGGGLIPHFFDLLIIGLLFLLLGIYPFARKKSRERLRKRKRFF